MPDEITNDAPVAEDVATGGEPVPAQTTEGAVETQEAPEAAAVGATQPEAQPEQGSDYRLPGQREQQSDRQLQWFQQKYAEALNSLQTYQQKLDEYEMAGMDEQEQQHYLAQKEYRKLSEEVEGIRRERATEEWRRYYAQFAPDNVPLTQIQNPIEMQHQVLIAQQQQIAKLQQEHIAMKKALAQQNQAAPVTTGGGGPPPPESIWDINKSPKEREKIFWRAKHGFL